MIPPSTCIPSPPLHCVPQIPSDSPIKTTNPLNCAAGGLGAGRPQSGDLGVTPPTPKGRYALIDMLGHTSTFYFKDSTTVTIIDARDKAVPVCSLEMRIASLTYALLTALALRFRAHLHGNAGEVIAHGAVAARLIAARRTYMEREKTTVADPKTPFRDVALDYMGEPLTAMRTHMAATDERRARSGPNAQVWMSYDPSRPPANRAMLKNYAFLRCDGGWC